MLSGTGLVSVNRHSKSVKPYLYSMIPVKGYGWHVMHVPMGWAQFCPMSLKMVTNDLLVMLSEP